jgi:hypothetical protein
MTTATQTQIRRDTATNLGAATPAVGELGYDTTNKRLVVGDGATAGGNKVCMAKDVQNQTFAYSTVGGTADAITLTNVPAFGSLIAGQKIRFRATADNTTAVTIATDGLTAKALKYMINGALTALPAGAIKSGAIIEASYDGTQYQLISGINPPLGSSTVFGPVQVDNTTITSSGGVISSAGNIMTALGVGSIVLAHGFSRAAGATIAGSSLTTSTLQSGGGFTGPTDSLSGTWQALQTIVAGDVGLWQRTV